ncbi:phage holin family protein [Clostridium sp. E02]|uniref:phage holin family protein n=1 Tax=Clostridium sp. E02 TaxID=2487134 RepID=UPI000F54041C|nr:phage holin family protein [Clostridium sp. E02]
MEKKLIMEKSMVGITSAWIMDKWGLLFPAIMLLTILMITDYISGMLAAKKEALDYPDNKNYGWNSKKSLIGIYKKVGYLLLILVGISTDFILFKFSIQIGIKFEHNTIFGLMVSVWLIINELLSILENAGRMGAKLPSFLNKVLAELHNSIEKDLK